MTDQPDEPYLLPKIDPIHRADRRHDGPLANAAVSTVIAWYSQELRNEERAEEPDQRRLEELESGRAEALKDRRRIPEIDGDGLRRLIDHYSALYRRLTTQ